MKKALVVLGIALAGMFGASSTPASALAPGDYVGEIIVQTDTWIYNADAHLVSGDPIEGTVVEHFAAPTPDMIFHWHQISGSGDKRTVRADPISALPPEVPPGAYQTWDITVQGDSFTGYGTGSAGPVKSSCSFQHV